MMIGSWSDEITVHRPVMILANGKSVGGVVVLAFRKRDEVGGGRSGILNVEF